MSDQKSEEDIVMDFSKVKSKISGWFGKGKKSHSEDSSSHHSTHSHHHSHDSESHSGNSSSQNEESKDSGMNIDIGKITSFFGKYWHYLALIAIVIFVIYMRSLVSAAPITDVWASQSIENSIRSQIINEVNSQNPNLPDQNKQKLVDQKLADFVKANKQQIDQYHVQLSGEFKKAISYTYNGKDYVYLGDIDSYYWLRFARNIVNHGNICDEIRNGECYDSLAIAPLGRQEVPNIHPYMIAITYKVANAIGFKIPLMQASLITPTIIAVFVAIAAFFAGLFLMGRITAVITAIILSCNPMYLSRSIGSDNDIYNLFFPLVILCFLFLAISAKDTKKRIIFAVLTGLSIGLFKLAWESGWWNIFNTILYGYVLYIGFIVLNSIYRHKGVGNLTKDKLLIQSLGLLVIIYVTGFIGFIISISITKGSSPMEYLLAPMGPISFFKFAKAAVNLNVWPNVLTTVAEFNAIPLASIPSQLFVSAMGKILFFMGIIGISLLLLNQLSHRREKYLLIFVAVVTSVILSSDSFMTSTSYTIYFVTLIIASLWYLLYIIFMKIDLDSEHQHHLLTGIILTVWLVGTLLAATRGVRFTMLVIPSMAISIGVCCEIIFRRIVAYFEDTESSKTIMTWIKVCLLLVMLIIPYTVASDSLKVTSSFVPNYNAAWDASLTMIRENSKKDAIINSWWDFGHWFKYTTGRGVTLDGATQNAPQLHWLGKLLLTDNETVARGILRMMDCGGNTAFDVLFNTTNDVPVAVDILNKIMVVEDHTVAKKIMSEYGIPAADQERVLEYSHCEPPENFLITSDDMNGKAGVWAHFGSWDFYKAEVASMKLGGMDKNQIISNLTSRKHRTLNNSDYLNLWNDLSKQFSDDQINAWIAPWPSFLSGEAGCSQKDDLIGCGTQLCVERSGSQCLNAVTQLIINTTDMSSRMVTNRGNVLVPDSLTYVKNGKITTIMYSGQTIGAGAVLIPRDNGYSAILAEPVLSRSMYVKLYYLNGAGLNYFDQFDKRSSPLGTQISVWKVNWEGKSSVATSNTTASKPTTPKSSVSNTTVSNTTASNTTAKSLNESI